MMSNKISKNDLSKRLDTMKEKLNLDTQLTTDPDTGKKREALVQYRKTFDNILYALDAKEEIFLPQSTISDFDTIIYKSLIEFNEWWFQFLVQLKMSLEFRLVLGKEQKRKEQVDIRCTDLNNNLNTIKKYDSGRLHIVSAVVIPALILITILAVIILVICAWTGVFSTTIVNNISFAIGLADFVLGLGFFIYERISDKKKKPFYIVEKSIGSEFDKKIEEINESLKQINNTNVERYIIKVDSDQVGKGAIQNGQNNEQVVFNIGDIYYGTYDGEYVNRKTPSKTELEEGSKKYARIKCHASSPQFSEGGNEYKILDLDYTGTSDTVYISDLKTCFTERQRNNAEAIGFNNNFYNINLDTNDRYAGGLKQFFRNIKFVHFDKPSGGEPQYILGSCLFADCGDIGLDGAEYVKELAPGCFRDVDTSDRKKFLEEKGFLPHIYNADNIDKIFE